MGSGGKCNGIFDPGFEAVGGAVETGAGLWETSLRDALELDEGFAGFDTAPCCACGTTNGAGY